MATTDATTGRPETAGPEPIKAVPVRHPGRGAAIVGLAVLSAMFVHTVRLAKMDLTSVMGFPFGFGG